MLVLAFGVDIPEGAFGVSSSSRCCHPVEFVAPVFNLAGFISIALPLFIVTMASQNIPGIAVLKVNQLRAEAGPLFAVDRPLLAAVGAVRRPCGQSGGDHGGDVRRRRMRIPIRRGAIGRR